MPIAALWTFNFADESPPNAFALTAPMPFKVRLHGFVGLRGLRKAQISVTRSMTDRLGSGLWKFDDILAIAVRFRFVDQDVPFPKP